MISVAIVEDNAPLRHQYAEILDRAPGFRCAGSYPDAESALSEIGRGLPTPDVILMDIGLPGMSGVDCAKRLKRAAPAVNIVMLTVYDDSELIFRALENGASGFLLKRTAPADLLSAIDDVHRGGAPMSPHVARLVVRSFRRTPVSNDASENLTPREEQVLRLVSRGLINKEIADELGITVETVRQHLKNIYTKLHVRSRTEAAMKFHGHG
ncbi:response regulator transcription factor [soil metagenome]